MLVDNRKASNSGGGRQRLRGGRKKSHVLVSCHLSTSPLVCLVCLVYLQPSLLLRFFSSNWQFGSRSFITLSFSFLLLSLQQLPLIWLPLRCSMQLLLSPYWFFLSVWIYFLLDSLFLSLFYLLFLSLSLSPSSRLSFHLIIFDGGLPPTAFQFFSRISPFGCFPTISPTDSLWKKPCEGPVGDCPADPVTNGVRLSLRNSPPFAFRLSL